MQLHHSLLAGKPLLKAASGRRVLRIGHGGAGAYAPPNSLRSLALSLQQGVDMVEFDVRGCTDGLILSHDDEVQTDAGPVRLSTVPCQEARSLKVSGEPLATLDDALTLVKGRALVNVDMKDTGHEEEVAAAILRHGMTDQTLVSSLHAGSLRRFRQALPEVATGMSYPEDKGGASGKPYMTPIVNVTLWGMRRFLLVTVGKLLAQSEADNVMLYHKIITPKAVEAFHSAGVGVFAWTADSLERMAQLVGMGVDGIATNRPDLFRQLPRLL